MALLWLVKQKIKLYINRWKWKKINKHNQTKVVNVFPINKVEIGRYTYGDICFYAWGPSEEKLTIGSFVSIAGNVKFMGGGNHSMDLFTTFPFKVKFFKQNFEAQTKGPIKVEDDVWIGTDSIILSGLTISQGAVIAAGSVVTKNVPPYAIVGGNPARILKYRFNQEQIASLLKIDYQKIDKNWILNHESLINMRINDLITSKEFQSVLKKESTKYEIEKII
ncbi:CatB-related O-acetyltransferase [Leuconostoc mesenteroides]|uniref:CatB-related O-acetyltransferase n=1 Tax=Leuconostoc mesenteroides TaxID=1245 RepID=UPI0032DFE838